MLINFVLDKSGSMAALSGATIEGVNAFIAEQRKGDDLYLSVFVDNTRARKFYERWGFVAEGSYAFMVGTHADEDIVMRRPL